MKHLLLLTGLFLQSIWADSLPDLKYFQKDWQVKYSPFESQNLSFFMDHEKRIHFMIEAFWEKYEGAAWGVLTFENGQQKVEVEGNPECHLSFDFEAEDVITIKKEEGYCSPIFRVSFSATYVERKRLEHFSLKE